MEYFKDWLYENAKTLQLNCNEVTLIIDSVSRNVVSVSACNVFTITYSFSGGVRVIVDKYLHSFFKLNNKLVYKILN